MSLNIKNERVHDLARRAALLSGRSQTSAIEEALREYLDRLTDAPLQRIASVDVILADIDARLTDTDPARLGTDDLYDEHGMPA